MTCIVGVIRDNKVTIGGDSAGVSGLDVTIRKDPKVFRVDDFLIGCTSSFRMIQLLRFSFKPPKRHPDTDPFEYMCTDFVEELRHCFKDGGFAEVDNNVERGGMFLVGYAGRLFSVENDFQVGEPMDHFAAVGCGEPFALGALAALGGALAVLSKEPISAVEMVTTALNIATHFSGGVRPPFTIDTI